jgi:predicted permease
VEAELDQELRFHYDAVAERYMAQGLSEAEARRRAVLEMGGVEGVKEECRDERRVSVFENIAADVAYAWRGMKRSPGFVLTAAVAIALGIGANTALFSIAYALVFRPLPVSNPETLRNVHIQAFGEGTRSGYGTMYNVSWVEFNHIRSNARTAEIAGIAAASMSRRGDSRAVRAHLVSDNLLPVLGATPLLGRFIRPEEASTPGSAPVVVLTHRTWQDWYGGALDVVGKPVELNRRIFTVVGVAQQEMKGPVIEVPDVWIPLSMQAWTRPGEPLIKKPNHAWIQLFARRKPVYDDGALEAEMSLLAHQAMQPHLPKKRAQVTVAPAAFFNYPFVRRNLGPLFAILFLAVTLVLIVACANVANMLLARGLTRRREIAIRLSMGAGRRRLLQQLLTESVMLSLAGAALAMLLAWIGAQALVRMIPAQVTGPHQVDLTPNGTVLAYTLGVAVVTGIVFGLLPALNSLRFDLTPALRSEGLAAERRDGRQRLQNTLITVQVAVCLVLLANAGLLLRGFTHATQLDPGQSTKNILIATFDLRQQQYTADDAARFINRLRENVSHLPAVSSASAGMVEPLHDQCGGAARVIGPDGTASPEMPTSCDEIAPDYFRTSGVRLLNGRDFTVAELFGTSKVAIIDERFAREKFGGTNPLGQRIRLGFGPQDDHDIVGVAATVRPLDLNGFGFPKVYTPLRGLRNTEAHLLVSYSGPFTEADRSVRAAAASLDANVTPSTRRIEESISTALVPARMAAAAASTLGALALLLACTGIYGLVSFAMTRRRREVGIRMALGASRTSVLKLMIWQSMKPVLTGAVVGIALAGAAAQLIRSMLYGISPLDPLSFAFTTVVLATVAVAAAIVPARGAVRDDPAVTLRHD